MTRCLAALLFAYCLCAQSNSISVNGTQLRIGMPKSDVLAFLAERNDLVRLEGLNDAWCVKDKDHGKQSGCGVFIQFGQEKLSVVSKTLGTANGEDAAAMIAAFFSTLDGLAKSGRTDLTFSTQEVETDDHMRLRILSFIAAGRKYTFTAQQPVGSQPTKNSSVDLTESFVLPTDRVR
jgi:hypothetical protein